MNSDLAVWYESVALVLEDIADIGRGSKVAGIPRALHITDPTERIETKEAVLDSGRDPGPRGSEGEVIGSEAVDDSDMSGGIDCVSAGGTEFPLRSAGSMVAMNVGGDKGPGADVF